MIGHPSHHLRIWLDAYRDTVLKPSKKGYFHDTSLHSPPLTSWTRKSRLKIASDKGHLYTWRIIPRIASSDRITPPIFFRHMKVGPLRSGVPQGQVLGDGNDHHPGSLRHWNLSWKGTFHQKNKTIWGPIFSQQDLILCHILLVWGSFEPKFGKQKHGFPVPSCFVPCFIPFLLATTTTTLFKTFPCPPSHTSPGNVLQERPLMKTSCRDHQCAMELPPIETLFPRPRNPRSFGLSSGAPNVQKRFQGQQKRLVISPDQRNKTVSSNWKNSSFNVNLKLNSSYSYNYRQKTWTLNKNKGITESSRKPQPLWRS